MPRKKKHTRLTDMHPVQRIVTVLMMIVILWVVVSAVYGAVQRRFIETITIDSETYDVSLAGYGFIISHTEIVKAKHDGQLIIKVPNGERVGRGQMVATFEYENDKGKKIAEELLAPHAGILQYHTDGYENIHRIKEVRSLDLKSIYEDSKETVPKVKDHHVSKDEACFQILDNMHPVKLVFKFSGQNKGLFKEEGDAFRIRFPEEGLSSVAFIEDIEKAKNESYVLCDIGPMADRFLQKRGVSCQAYRTELTTLRLDKGTVIYQGESPGVYIRNRGIVTWQPVKIIKKSGDQVITETLPKGTTIITTPHLVREGDILK